MRRLQATFKHAPLYKRALVSTVLFGTGTACDTGSLLLMPDAAAERGPLESSLDAGQGSPAREDPSLSPSERAAAEAPEGAEAEAPESDPADPGRRLGRYRLTYYFATAERPNTPEQRLLRDPSCKPLARVSRRFARKLTLEGTGVLEDGRLVNVAGNCKCGHTCFVETGVKWGIGARDRRLSPFRSVAVDRSRIPVGQWLYVPELDGLRMPGHAPWGGFVHDGCVVADDVGGGVRGRHLDFFTARRPYYTALHDLHPLTRVTVFKGGRRCAEHERGESHRTEGSIPLS